MVINYCDIHNPTYIQNGLSKYVLKYIVDDIPLKEEQLAFVEFYKGGKLFSSIVFDKNSFSKYHLKERYDVEIEFNTSHKSSNFFIEHVASYCALCVKAYQKKHHINFTDKLIIPSFYDLDA